MSMNIKEIDRKLKFLRYVEQELRGAEYEVCIDCEVLTGLGKLRDYQHFAQFSGEHTAILQTRNHAGVDEWIRAFEYLLGFSYSIGV